VSKSHDHLADVLGWDWGAAYEILLSTETMMRPKIHGLSAPWAAGVRKRLSSRAQAEFKAFFGPPFGLFAYTPLHIPLELDHPKSVGSLLDSMEAVPDDEFMRRLHWPLVGGNAALGIVGKALSGTMPTEAEVDEYRKFVGRARILPPPTIAETRPLFQDMLDPASAKKRWLSVMREYQAAFFAQEEERLAPVLARMADDAREMSRSMSVTDLIERLSNGFTISEESDLARLVLVPSVWCHPYVVNVPFAERALLLAWGSHPAGYRLAPGESVPDQAVLVLRALSDPTRLRLMRLLASQPRSPQALARELKLTLPTVSHHMRELRLAGLVRLEAQLLERGRETKYAVRWQSAERAFSELSHFVAGDEVRG
jgi:DNA-binding transcriptional ArsR family regulator